MAEKIKTLKEERSKIIADQRAIVDAADAEKRDYTADENTNYENLEKRFDELEKEISEAEASEKLSSERKRSIEDRETMLKTVKKSETRGLADEGKPDNRDIDNAEEYRAAYNSFLRGGINRLSDAETRALSVGLDTEGGYILTPETFVNRLIKKVNNMVFIRQRATVLSDATGGSWGIPTLETDAADADWTTELGTGSLDSSLAFGKRSLTTNPVAKRVKISNDLIRRYPGIDNLVADQLAYKFGITHEQAFMTGGGANMPLGVFTASSNGISTSRDVAGTNTTTAIVADSLIDTKYSMKPQYMATAEWMFHRDAVKMIRKLKTGAGDYLWKEGLTDKPDTILDLPYVMSEYVPNTFTTGLYVGILGDFSFYWIADALNMTVQVLDQLYAETNQTGYIGRMESDGMPVLEEAFARVKLG